MTTATAIMWFPEIHQIKIQRNANWLQSAFIGVTAPVLNLWQVIWYIWLAPLPKCIAYTFAHITLRNWPGVLVIAWVNPFFTAFRLFLTVGFYIPLRGLMGDLSAHSVSLDERYRQIRK